MDFSWGFAKHKVYREEVQNMNEIGRLPCMGDQPIPRPPFAQEKLAITYPCVP
jgi:hypothetical protein